MIRSATTIGWLQDMSSFIYPGASDKRNRNPNWTDAEITRFLNILMEEPVLRDLYAQRNKQVFNYVSQKMQSEGSEKSWDQCRVKLKNLKSQWRYVRERVPAIEEADMEDEDTVRQIMTDCQNRGVSPTCVKHLRMLKQFLDSLSAVRRGLPVPKYRSTTELILLPAGQPGSILDRLKKEDDSIEDGEDDTDEYQPWSVEFPAAADNSALSPPASPPPSERRTSSATPEARAPDIWKGVQQEERGSLRIMLPADINSAGKGGKRSAESVLTDPDTASPRAKQNRQARPAITTKPPPALLAAAGRPASRSNGLDPAAGIRAVQQELLTGVLTRLQAEMSDRFFQFHRESELRYLAWEQERWKLEQSLLERWRSEQREAMERWRAEQRSHEREMLAMFGELAATSMQAVLATATIVQHPEALPEQDS